MQKLRDARELQEKLRATVALSPLTTPVRLIAGCDISSNKYSPVLYAAIVVLSFPDLAVVEVVHADIKTDFPYIPGYLSFREFPALEAAYKKLTTRPDVFVVDGQGIAHPRRMGIAAHLGVMLDVPSFGVAKNKLFGEGEVPEPHAESVSYLYDEKDIVGAYVVTKENAKPVIVSAGHRITLDEAVKLTLLTRKGYRMPEPTRLAHEHANAFRREKSAPQPYAGGVRS